MDIGSKVIVRTYSAGCFVGILEKQSGKEVTLSSCRRLWRWAGAASLSELAVRGTSNPAECKFPAPTTLHDLTEAIEVILCTDEAYTNISEVPVWSE
jgi:hypothetical protein